MALDLGKLVAKLRFNLKTDALGTLLIHSLSSSALSSLRREFVVSFIDADSTEFVRFLLTLVGQQDTNGTGEYTDDRINREQAKLLSKEELERFAVKFVAKNAYLKEKVNAKTAKSKNNDGDRFTIITQGPGDNFEKHEDESARDYLKNVMHRYRIDREDRAKKSFDSVRPKNLFSESLLGLIDQNRKLSERLGSSIESYESIKIPELHENPVYETNNQLKAIGAEFIETSRLIKNMNDLGLQMAIERW